MDLVIFSLPQRLDAEIVTGHQLLRDLLCDAVSSVEKETGEKRYIVGENSNSTQKHFERGL